MSSGTAQDEPFNPGGVIKGDSQPGQIGYDFQREVFSTNLMPGQGVLFKNKDIAPLPGEFNSCGQACQPRTYYNNFIFLQNIM